MEIETLLNQEPAFKKWLPQFEESKRALITGLSGSGEALFLANLYHQKPRQILIVEPNLFMATQLLEDFSGLIDDKKLFYFPVEEMLATEMAVSSAEYRAERIKALNFLATDEPGIVIAPLAGLRRFLPGVETFKKATLHFKVGEEYPLENLPQRLVELGYERDRMVEKPGDFAIRGSIVDIFPLMEEQPLRIDFFDEEVDSIRYFEADSQRSVENLTEIQILPATDLIVETAVLKQQAEVMQQQLQKEINGLISKEDRTQLQRAFEPVIASFSKGERISNINLYLEYIFPEQAGLTDYLAKEGLVVVDDYARMQEAERAQVQEEAEWITNQLEKRQILATQTFGHDARTLIRQTSQQALFFTHLQKGLGGLKFDLLENFAQRSMQQFFGQMPLVKTEMERFSKQNQTVLVVVQGAERQKKVADIFNDFDIVASVAQPGEIKTQKIQVIDGFFQNGFEWPWANLIVITDKELFHKLAQKRARRQTLDNAQRIKSYSELSPGDYVVHVNHGIGKYTGMQTLEVDGVHQDYITIEYADDGKLFIPVTQMGLVQKYVSSEAKSPRINKLGGTSWHKTKQKVAAKIEDIADDLIELYAKRESEVGYSFSPDDSYQKEFEDAFPYAETDDQLRSTAEIKHDMEGRKPMDRLLVGDVGYGKTEVALRAAFKAVQDGKQVAFLVPTTILAQQHYETMQNRFEGFPITVDMMSRFRTKKQQNETLKNLKNGSIDIVVGTHRILSQDLKFADLGLLIIDEEQRFGVKHKERLKQLRAQVDVLTLTATPIPRTLHMSMLGVRDLSVIETPPRNRYPVQTYVMEQNYQVIREAIEREMERGGQVFFLHNRVEDITRVVAELQALVPDARIGFAHGQMTEVQLEGVLYDFIQGQYDVLVTTTIIETGVDIPNVNTLFVENADHMGLSQLYQLRGRVGRSSRVAYAYFMYQANKVLTEVSEKRLQAIKDFTDLGSGFKIAMRDLSIRGAGNLLGKQQHGFIDSVGFDLYSQMLGEAIAKRQGQQQVEQTDAELDLGVEAYLPSTYIDDERQKIEVYKRIRKFENDEQVEELREDLLDRFGDAPVEVMRLILIAQLKMWSDHLLLERVKRTNDQITVLFSKKATQRIAMPVIFEALSATKLKAAIGTPNDCVEVKLVIQPRMEIDQWLDELQRYLKALVDLSTKEMPVAETKKSKK